MLAIALAPGARGEGLGTALGSRFLEEMASLGAGRVKVVVSAGNAHAVAAYLKMGFDNPTPVEVHTGEPSLEMTWSG